MTFTHKKPRLIVASILVVAGLLSLPLALIGLFNIYQNNKTDGHGSGIFTIEHCTEKNYTWRIYSCTGEAFAVGGGGESFDNVSLKTFREYSEGDRVPDIYAPEFTTPAQTDSFVTGRERASVMYNARWIALVFIGVLAPAVTITYIATTQFITKNRQDEHATNF